MPTLPVDRTGAFAATLGIMLYPDEDEDCQRRARIYAAQFVAKPMELHLGAGGVLAEDDVRHVLANCGEHLDDADARYHQGLTAGYLFQKYHELAHVDPDLASWENAARALKADAPRLGLSASRSQVNEARKRYRSVTHLWAAWCMRGKTLRRIKSAHYDAWDDFQFFMMEAQILLNWGRSWRHRREKSKPPLWGEAWSLPNGWEPPELEPGWELTGLRRTIDDEVIGSLGRAGRPRKSA